jgi:hypothetical protein
MYNILLDKLPQYIPSKIKIRTDFREWIKFELLMQDNTIEEEKKIELALNLLYFGNINNIETALKDIIWFYSCGKKENEIKETKQNKKEMKQIYSYEFDDMHIYTAFKTQYNIDLNSIKYLHWWKFKAMFEDLKEDNKIVEIMGYRSCDLSKIKDKEERKRIQKMKKMYALPDMRTQEQKEADFGSAFW